MTSGPSKKNPLEPDSNRVLELERTNIHKRNRCRETEWMVTLTPHESSLVSLSPSTEMSNRTGDTQMESML